jgi:hypothetical protein
MSEAAGAVSGAEGSGFYAVVGVTLVGAVVSALLLRRINWL